MATTARHTIARNHSEYDHCITLRVSNYLTQKNHVKTIYKYSVLHGQYTSTPNYTAKIQEYHAFISQYKAHTLDT